MQVEIIFAIHISVCLYHILMFEDFFCNCNCNYSTHKVFSVFNSRRLVAAFNDRRFSFSAFPNSSRPQLPASHFSQLQLSTDKTATQSQSYVTTMFFRCRGNNVSTELFPSNRYCTVACLHSSYLAVSLHVTLCRGNRICRLSSEMF
jgi:hypothetical protein